MTGIVARQSVVVRAPPERVWRALTDPDMIKEYLFGTQVSTDWKVGSPIRYRGVWEGRTYEDKGMVLRVVPGRLLETTFWSSLSGVSDTPENYKQVTYELTPVSGGTRLTVIQDNNTTEEERNHSEQNWGLVLAGLKKLLER
ncbi:MAG: SRPBCC domain-containing protein [Methanomicrobiales archaeon]|nr:SRPBCC domain-containing protein [Methanomicrobiales archaeon]